MLSIYEYPEAWMFLRDAWAEKKKLSPAFSLRAWARKLGLEHNAPLSLMLAGKRPIPRKYIPSFVEHLELLPAEGVYLETLVEYSNARDPKQKDYYERRLAVLAPKERVTMAEVETFRLLGDPLHATLREMTDLKGFKASAPWIREKLRFKANLAEIEAAIERLLALGLLQADATGRWMKTNKHVTNRPDVADKGSQEYHQRVSQLASQLVALQPVEMREYNGYALNVKKSALPLAKERIRAFVKDLICEIEAPAGEGEQTYQFNVQLFSLTQS